MHNSLSFPKHTAKDMLYVLTWWSRQACSIMAGIHTADLRPVYLQLTVHGWTTPTTTLLETERHH